MVDFTYPKPDGTVGRFRKKAPIQTRRHAEQFEREARERLILGTAGAESTRQTRPGRTFIEFVPSFLTYSENNNKRSTVTTKRAILDQHLIPFFGQMRLDQIGFAQIEDYKALMRKKTSGARARQAAPSKWAFKRRYGAGSPLLSAKSVNNTLAVLRKLLSLAHEHGEISSYPRFKFLRTDKAPFQYLEFEEADRLLAAAEPAWHCLLLVALRTGLRQGELIGLQWTDFDPVRAHLHVRRTVWRGHADLPKGGRTRVVELPRSVVEALGQHRHLRGPYIFCQEDGSPLTPGLMKRPLARALQRSGISRPEGRIGWHDLRHTYGSHLAMRNVPLKAIQELMGHATIEMTMRYAHLSPEVKQSAVQRLDEPAPGQTGAAENTGTAPGRHRA